MSRSKLMLKRLKELFDEPELSLPEPVIDPACIAGAACKADAAGQQAEAHSPQPGEATPGKNGRRHRRAKQMPAREQGQANPPASGENPARLAAEMREGAERLANIDAGQTLLAGQAGWEDYLDAIRRDEVIGFSYEEVDIVRLTPPFTEDRNGAGVRLTPPLPENRNGAGVRLLPAFPESRDGAGVQLTPPLTENRNGADVRLSPPVPVKENGAGARPPAPSLESGNASSIGPASPLPGNGNDGRREACSRPGHTLSASLAIGNQSFGVLELDGDPERAWTEQEAGLVAEVAQEVALHLENLRLLDQAERYRNEAEQAVRRMTRQGWESFLEETENAQNGSPWPRGYVYDRIRVHPLEAEYSSEPGTGKGSGTALGAVTVCPITVRQETIGELIVEASHGQAVSELVGSVAERLSVHIESLRLLEETERSRQQLDRRAAELETVARVSTAAATILDPPTLLQSVVNLTKESFRLYGVHIYLMEEQPGRLILAASAGKVGEAAHYEKHTVRLENGEYTIARVAHARSGAIIPDIQAQPGYKRYPYYPEAVSELAVPMIVGEQVVGVFGVLSETAGRFYEDDMRTFSTLASQVAIALRNAELYAEQMETVARLRELDQLKSAFLANMSHELRTPLNSIIGFTQVIREGLDGPLTGEMGNDLGLIEKNGKHLLQLINDVLDMAKIESGRLSLTCEPFDLRDLIEEVLETTSPLARDKSLYLKLVVNPLESMAIIADQFRIRQILLNLVGNALKFTDSGGITLFAESWADTILVRVQDTGIGIPPEKLETIFEAFSQVDNSTTRKAGGTGLGLPISRRLVEMHGGRLWAVSNGVAGEGSTLCLELPVEARSGDR